MTREELSERAARILGDKSDGSPIGDLTAALDEVERLRVDLTTTTDLLRIHKSAARNRAKALDRLRKRAAALSHLAATMRGLPNDIARTAGKADGVAEALATIECAAGGEE